MGFFKKLVSNPIGTIGEVGQGAIDTAKDVVDTGANITTELLKPAFAVGKWSWENPVEAAILGAAGWYFAPEISAWMNPATGEAVTGTAAGTEVGATAMTAEAAATAYEQAAAVAAAENAAAWAAAEQAAAAELAAQQAAIIAAENAAWDAAAIDLASSATPEFAASAAAAGLGFKEALDYARAGLLINAVTGDPLGLSDVSGSGQNTFANSGFAQVPIPEEWKSPTYAASSAPIDLSTIFSNQNMLGGTQWANLPSQRNVSFNDIFASGQQQTPMGTPVDINQIVGSILGQTATS